jgi:predicted RND superfamily exporter protein
MFLNVDHPAIAFFGFVFVIGIVLRYALTLIAGFSFDCSCCDLSWYERYDIQIQNQRMLLLGDLHSKT